MNCRHHEQIEIELDLLHRTVMFLSLDRLKARVQIEFLPISGTEPSEKTLDSDFVPFFGKPRFDFTVSHGILCFLTGRRTPGENITRLIMKSVLKQYDTVYGVNLWE